MLEVCGGMVLPYVHDSAIDVAEFLEAKEPGSVGRVIEIIRLCCQYLH